MKTIDLTVRGVSTEDDPVAIVLTVSQRIELFEALSLAQRRDTAASSGASRNAARRLHRNIQAQVISGYNGAPQPGPV